MFLFEQIGKEGCICFRYPESRYVGRDCTEFVLCFASDCCIGFNKNDSGAAEHCGVDVPGAGIEIEKSYSTFRYENMCFAGSNEFTGFIDLSVVIVVNPVGGVPWDFVCPAIGVVVDAVCCPSANLGKEWDFAVFINGAIFVVVNPIRCFLQMFVEYVIGDAGFGDEIAPGKRCERISILEFIPESADVSAVKVGKLTIAAVKERTG